MVTLRRARVQASHDAARAAQGTNEFGLTDAQLLTHVTVGTALHKHARCGGLQVVRQPGDRGLEVGRIQRGDELLEPSILGVNHIEVVVVVAHGEFFLWNVGSFGGDLRPPPNDRANQLAKSFTRCSFSSFLSQPTR